VIHRGSITSIAKVKGKKIQMWVLESK